MHQQFYISIKKIIIFFTNFKFHLLTLLKDFYNMKYINAAVAQLVERRTENPYVVGSIPTCGKGFLRK